MIIRFQTWVLGISAIVVLWNECAENPFVFCYRMGVGVFTMVRYSALVPVPISYTAARNFAACSNRSVIFSTRSTMSKD